MKFAYADPPYVGQAKKHYGADEVDHKMLIEKLQAEYDGWALSCSTPSLCSLLLLCPPDIRIAAWVKPFASFKPGVNPAFAWESVLFRGSRKRDRDEDTVRDWVSANITLGKGLVGAKPLDFCNWIIDLLGARPGEDVLDEIFPGTALLTATWNARTPKPLQMQF
jgi:hypothetical protein